MQVVQSISGWTDIENPYRLSRGSKLYILIYVIEIYRVGDNRRLAIRRRLGTFLISWGQKTLVKHCYVDLSPWYESWFVIIWYMYRYECHIGSFYRNPTILEKVSINGWVNTENLFYWNNTTGNNTSTDVSLSMENVKIKCKEYFL